MLVLRCTHRLLYRLGPPVADPPESTTVLGDWYAKPFSVGRKPFVLMISGTTRIAVVVPGRGSAHLIATFLSGLADLLARLAVPTQVIEREMAASQEVVLAETDSRSLLGTLNDFATISGIRLAEKPDTALVDLSVWLSRTPVAPLGYRYPADAARELFGLAPDSIAVSTSDSSSRSGRVL